MAVGGAVTVLLLAATVACRPFECARMSGLAEMAISMVSPVDATTASLSRDTAVHPGVVDTATPEAARRADPSGMRGDARGRLAGFGAVDGRGGRMAAGAAPLRDG